MLLVPEVPLGSGKYWTDESTANDMAPLACVSGVAGLSPGKENSVTVASIWRNFGKR